MWGRDLAGNGTARTLAIAGALALDRLLFHLRPRPRAVTEYYGSGPTVLGRPLLLCRVAGSLHMLPCRCKTSIRGHAGRNPYIQP